MPKKVKITEKKSNIKVLKQTPADTQVHLNKENLEEIVESPDHQITRRTTVAGQKAFVLKETPAISPQTVAVPARNTQTIIDSSTENLRPYDSITSNRESYLLRDNPSTSVYQEMMHRPTGEISGRRANPTLEQPRLAQEVRAGPDNTLQGNPNQLVQGPEDLDRKYVQYEDNNQMRTKKRSDWRL